MICRVCDSGDLEPAIDLGDHPWANHFLKPEEVGKEPFYPLRVVFCHACHTAQLDHTVPKEVMFSDHTYLSGITRTLSDHFRETAHQVDARFGRGERPKSVLDIGSNDGTQLKHYQALGYDVLGVEPSRAIAELANAAGVPTVRDYFNLELAKSLDRRFDVINASGVFFHLEELHSVAEGIRHLLADDGVFVVHFLYMRQIVSNLAFDQIYHEHLLYYNLETIDTLLRRHGLRLFDATLAPIHGGSIIAFVTKDLEARRSEEALEGLLAAEARDGSNTLDVYRRFAAQIGVLRAENLDYLAGRKAAGKQIFGFGAPVKGNTLLNYFGVGTETLDCLVEPQRIAARALLAGPAHPDPDRIELSQPPDVYYVLAWNFRDEILRRNEGLIARGIEFYFPIQPA